jgi:hypothetical protein
MKISILSTLSSLLVLGFGFASAHCAQSAHELFQRNPDFKGVTEAEVLDAISEDPELCMVLGDYSLMVRDDTPPPGAGWKDSYGYWHPGLEPSKWIQVGLYCVSDIERVCSCCTLRHPTRLYAVQET